MSWQGVFAMQAASLLGVGVLALPEAFAKLGWAVGFALLFASAGASVHSGFLLSRARQRLAPRAQTYGDLADAVFGPRGESGR